MSSVARYLTMNNGLKMPSVGLGTYLLKQDTLKQALDYALFLGYRHIDTALTYENEVEIGEVIHERIKAGRLKRSEVFVTTKVPSIYLSRDAAIKSTELSLENLKLKYVDMLLIHHPWGVANIEPFNSKEEKELCQYNILETWDAFEHVQNQNLTKSIGLSNFNPSQIQKIWDKADVKPANLQLELHAYWQQNVLQKVCCEKNIIMTAYAPLGAPFKSDMTKSMPKLLEDPLIIAISEEYGKSPSQILLNFLLQKNIGVLPKSQSMERIKENFEVLDWKITQMDCERIEKLDNTVKYFPFEWAHAHPDFDKNQPF
ncbi:aldo-keto reductase family 1 member A1-like [Haliotis rubra]|uniref:aldo-keto reductase family 1 member A1-like n=1 Tax=Haliotis rubra TaxID=36100 RepID=UPI001EE61C4D|nr:aldo-keto reductase family 1 member A1-like [Haliotis rubra]